MQNLQETNLKIKSITEVSSALFDSATGRNGRDPSVSAQIFFLKNKGKEAGNPWADVQQVENNINLSDIITSANARIIEAPKEALAHAPKEIDIKQINKAKNS